MLSYLEVPIPHQLHDGTVLVPVFELIWLARAPNQCFECLVGWIIHATYYVRGV